MTLRVIEQFGTYRPGDIITDPEIAQAILDSEQGAYVRQVPDDSPAKKPTSKK